MDDNKGWVSLYRKTLENPYIMKDSDHLAIWCYLLLKATHKNYKALFGKDKIILKKGQLIIGRKKIADDLRLKENKIERVLKCFESEQQIQQRTNTKGRLITILNWDAYQINQQQNQQQVDNKPTTSQQQIDTNNNIITNNIINDNINKKEKRRGIESSKLDDTHQIFSQVINCFNKIGIKEDGFKKNKMEFNFKNNENNQRLIQKLLDKNYTAENILDVIYLKYDQWIENNDKNKTDMTTFFRPSTVLGDKFDEYYQEAKAKEIS